MHRTLLTLALLVPAAALACDDSHDTQAWWTPSAAPAAAPGEVTVAELAKLAKAKAAVPIDANLEATRKTEGVIPGAVLLTSSSQYALTELPADKSSHLVFYCASERCTASHQAARRALEAGYPHVAVLASGIKGWNAAGQPVSRSSPASVR